MFKTKKSDCFLGKALEISTTKLKLMVTLDVGPRIIWLSKTHGENIMFNDTEDKICKDVSAIYGNDEVWHIYGGHRIWLSPESDASYYPDNHAVRYRVEDGEVVFTPPLSRISETQTVLRIKHITESKLEVNMEVTNKGSSAKTLAVWGLTVLKPDAYLSVKNNDEDTGYLPLFNVVHWPYNDLNDKRLEITKEAITVRSDSSMENALKVGSFNKNLVITYKYKDTTFKKYLTSEEGLSYPDFQCNFETYTNNLIHEAETLSPLVTLKWREKICHSEIWEVF